MNKVRENISLDNCWVFLCTPGASKQLGTIIEGESLLNDGATIVLFNVLLYELIPGQSQTGIPKTGWKLLHSLCHI